MHRQPEESRSSARWPLIGGALLALALGSVGGYLLVTRDTTPSPIVATDPKLLAVTATPASSAPAPVGAAAPPAGILAAAPPTDPISLGEPRPTIPMLLPCGHGSTGQPVPGTESQYLCTRGDAWSWSGTRWVALGTP